MGKRGPKIKHHDEFHRVKRELMKRYREKWKKQKEEKEREKNGV